DGERYCLLVDSVTGLPLFYPNLFVTTQIRNASLSFSAMESVLVGVSVLIRFCQHAGIDLDKRFQRKEFLVRHEIEALADFCQLKLRQEPISQKVISIAHKKERLVASQTTYVRLTHIARYLAWLPSVMSPQLTREHNDKLRDMVLMIKTRRPVKKGRNSGVSEKGLSDGQIEVLFEIFRPDSDLNPFDRRDVRVRNRLIFLMLFHLGVRSGELLNIRIRDIDFANNQIVVARRADDKNDPRLDQPLVKTLDRRLPVKDTLIQEIHDYIVNYRKLIPNANRHDFLFVTHKPGPTVGQPISKASYNKVMAIIRDVSPDLYSFTGHALRHKWNERFSELMDSQDTPPDEAQQEQLRSWLMGWRQGSGTAATYNQRFIKRKASEASMALQESKIRVPEFKES
ncbi:MAG: site-specific integrase, partial [Thiotrichales bacterium]|nr:site-specific integrase [Thiotrichales bacterium]